MKNFLPPLLLLMTFSSIFAQADLKEDDYTKFLEREVEQIKGQKTCDSLRTSYNRSLNIIQSDEFVDIELLTDKERVIFSEEIQNVRSTAKLIFKHCGEKVDSF